MRRSLAAAVVLAAAWLTWGLGPLREDPALSAGSKCPKGTIAQNRYFSLYREAYALISCRRSTGKTFVEAGDYLSGTADLNGPIIARANYFCDEEDTNDCNTVVNATDVVNDPNGGLAEFAGPKPFSKAGSVQVSRDLRLAWIACRLRRQPDLERPRRRPQCAEPGHSRNIVYVKTSSDADVKALDRGRSIDPSSLRLRRGRLSWLHSGRRKSFDITRLPQPPDPTPTPSPTPTPTPPPTPSPPPTPPPVLPIP